MTLNGEHQRALALLARNPKRHQDVNVVAWLHATTSTERVGRGRQIGSRSEQPDARPPAPAALKRVRRDILDMIRTRYLE